MDIKPRTGRRDYAKRRTYAQGGLVEDEYMPGGMGEAAPPLPPGLAPGGRTGDLAMDAAAGGRTGDMAMGADAVDPTVRKNRVKPVRYDKDAEAAFLAYTPDKMEGYSSELRRAWNRKNAPNG